MPNFLSFKIPNFVYWIIGILVLVIALIIVICFFTKHLNEKRKKDCFNLLNKICAEKIEGEYKIEQANSLAYDFYIETINHKYYIKLINNPNNQEICVNNAIKWQLRNSIHEKDIRFVEGVEHLMRMDIKNDGKTAHKLYIVYPNARALLKVINECEMVFITPETDIYGAKIVTYKQLEENYNLMKF